MNPVSKSQVWSVRRCLDARLEASSAAVGAGRGQSDQFFWHVVQMSHFGGSWVPQWVQVQYSSLDLHSGLNPRVVSSRPQLGSTLGVVKPTLKTTKTQQQQVSRSEWTIEQQAHRLSTTVAISLKFISSCSAFLCKASGKRAIWVLQDGKIRGWERIGSLSVKSHRQILEETRIQDPAQF